MGWRFHRRFKIFPGVSVNLSRSGISTSVGVKGARVTLGHGQVRETVGIPGTGISYTHVEGSHHQTAVKAPGHEQLQQVAEPLPKGSARRGWLIIAAVIAIAGYMVWLLSR
jgi:hypothetical protein